MAGGTLINLCRKILKIQTFEEIKQACARGNLKNIDLTIGDVSKNDIEILTKDITSSNFGKFNNNATNDDIALGIANMIFETIGMMAVFATQNKKTKNIIITGNIANIPQINEALAKIEKMHNVKFIIPKNAAFGTVIGAIKTI